jgi:hypothetical protein
METDREAQLLKKCPVVAQILDNVIKIKTRNEETVTMVISKCILSHYAKMFCSGLQNIYEKENFTFIFIT